MSQGGVLGLTGPEASKNCLPSVHQKVTPGYPPPHFRGTDRPGSNSEARASLRLRAQPHGRQGQSEDPHQWFVFLFSQWFFIMIDISYKHMAQKVQWAPLPLQVGSWEQAREQRKEAKQEPLAEPCSPEPTAQPPHSA